jgi:hypothetical protein
MADFFAPSDEPVKAKKLVEAGFIDPSAHALVGSDDLAAPSSVCLVN